MEYEEGDEHRVGAVIPEEYDGAGYATHEATNIFEEITASGPRSTGPVCPRDDVYFAVHSKLWVERDEGRGAPEMVRGEKLLQSFSLTEPNAESESNVISTTAEDVTYT